MYSSKDFIQYYFDGDGLMDCKVVGELIGGDRSCIARRDFEDAVEVVDVTRDVRSMGRSGNLAQEERLISRGGLNLNIEHYFQSLFLLF